MNCGSGERDAYVRRLEEGLNFRILSSLEDHILDAGYFYDSNFHANDPGTVYNTILLINDLKRVTGNMSPVSVPVPEPFAKSGGGLNGELLSDGVFLYMLSEKGILIKGLTEEGRALAVLTVPSELSGYRVYGIDSFAFENSKAFSVILPESVSSMGEGIFKNASSLKTVSLHCRSLPEVSADLLYGAPDGLVLYVNKEVYGRFVTDYFWGAFSDVLRPAE